MEKQEKRLGRPVTLPGVTEYTVRLDIEYADWAKTLRGGLSGLLRDLLKAEYLKQNAEAQK